MFSPGLGDMDKLQPQHSNTLAHISSPPLDIHTTLLCTSCHGGRSQLYTTKVPAAGSHWEITRPLPTPQPPALPPHLRQSRHHTLAPPRAAHCRQPPQPTQHPHLTQGPPAPCCHPPPSHLPPLRDPVHACIPASPVRARPSHRGLPTQRRTSSHIITQKSLGASPPTHTNYTV